jgi:hypothetical protein
MSDQVDQHPQEVEAQRHRAGHEDDQAMYRRVVSWVFRTAPSPEPASDRGMRL